MGVSGAIAVGAVGAIILILLLARWLWIAPSVPVIPPGTDDKVSRLILENYQTLREAALEDTLRILDAFVMKLLFPLFTSFVGYVFGSQANRES